MSKILPATYILHNLCRKNVNIGENIAERDGKVKDNLVRNGAKGSRSCSVAEYCRRPMYDPCEIKGKEK